ncbi:MFS transporter [Streptomyces sp. NPDC048659]|uniref:MFS transporter n=1 Tax=Streptomyces sp. NPDC048659 TaxID=3155489 RepID=UPI003425F8AC
MKTRYTLRRYLTGAVAARAGDEMAGPALMLAAFALSGSGSGAAFRAAALLAGVTVAAAVGGPVLGALLDRARRPGRLLAVALALYATGLGTVLAGLGRLPFGVTLALAVLTGLLGPALSGGWTSQLPSVLPPDRLPRANALDALTFSAASLAGPALAGGVAETLGAPAAVVASLALIAAALPAAWTLPARPRGTPEAPAPHTASAAPRPPKPPARGPVAPVLAARLVRSARALRAARAVVSTRAARSARSARSARAIRAVLGDVVAGFRAIAGRPALAGATLSSAVSCAAQGMFTACLPLLGARVLGEAGRGALLLSCTAVAAMAANAVLARFPALLAPDTLLRAGALVQAAATALAAGGRPGLLVAAALLAGCGEGPQLTALFAIRHREAPARLRGQIFTTGASLKITGFAVGAAVAGPLAPYSLTGTLVLAAGVSVLAALAPRLVRGSVPARPEPAPQPQ